MHPLLQLVPLNATHKESFSFFLTVYHVYVKNCLIFCTGLTLMRFLFGNVIECLNDNRYFSPTFMNIKCYLNGTLTQEPGQPTLYHDYYQWVPVYLILLAFGFHFPYSLWSRHYGKYLRTLESLATKSEEMIQMIQDSNGNFIFLKTIALELFYTVYLVGIVWITDIFFNHLWSRFHWSWRAVYKIFPDHGECFFNYHHSSGTSENKLQCLLPLCSIYRKIFVTLYFGVWGLMALNGWMVVYRLCWIGYRKEWMNVWWAFTIAEQCADTWRIQKDMRRALKNGVHPETKTSIEMMDKV